MSLRFILGRAGTGKTSQCMKEICEQLKANPSGSPIYFLVPDQMTFQSEYQFMKTPGINGMIRAQVFSFTRLAWRILQETGGIARFHLDSVGLHMLIRKIVEENKEAFQVFGRAIEKKGFIDQMEAMITEFKRYCITPEEVSQKRSDIASEDIVKGNEIIIQKLHDFQLIYHELERALLVKYVDSEDYLKLLAERIPMTPALEETEIYIDGFHSFTPQELQVLYKLIKHCRRVTVALTLDKPRDLNPPHELDLFSMTAKTYQQLKSFVIEEGIEEELDVVLNEPPVRFSNEPSLIHLEKYYDSRPTKAYDGKTAIKQLAAVNRRAEVEQVAREILALVRDDGYRYRDFAILTRNMNDYHDLLETIFDDYQIPIFFDQKRTMLYHPVIELIRSALDVFKGNWRYEPIFRCVKTELLFPIEENMDILREEMDQLENFVLANGIQGKKWTEKKEWEYKKYQAVDGLNFVKTDRELAFEKRLNTLRYIIVDPLATLQKSLRRANTGRQMCEALYYFLEGLEIPRKIEKMKADAEINGDLSKVREHDQVWRAVIDLLDQMVEVLGEEKISDDLFIKLIEAGIENMKFAIVPPSMDQVLAGDLERSRFFNIKGTFILGVNDGVLPAKPKEEGIISEEERELLIDNGFKIAPGSRQQLLDENFVIYLALTSASERLFVSYPMADEEGKALIPSILMKRLKDLFPNLEEGFIFNEPNEQSEELQQLQFINNPQKTLSYLTAQLQSWQRGYPISDIWWDAYNWFVSNEKWRAKSRRVITSLFYQNEAVQLTKDTAKELYGEQIKTSVSRMERYESCAFSQFASHGLYLKERKAFKLEAPDIGQLFHAALKMISDYLNEHGMTWSNLTKKECEQLASKAVEKLAPFIQNEILLSSNRLFYIKRKLQQVVGRASTVLSEHARRSGFEPIGLELGFGMDGPLPPLQFNLKNGCTMEVVGRIDRVDKAETADGLLLRVIDYKSSSTDLNLSEMYFGLALQMLVYLDVVISNAKNWLGKEADPAGVLYFHVHNPVLNKANVPTEEEIEQELFKQFKMKGLLVAEQETIRLMDNTLEQGYSEVIPVALKKSGEFYHSSSIASRHEFTIIQSHLRKMMEKIGFEITEGKIAISPYKLKEKNACGFCPYHSFCQFDQTLEENNYRVLTQYKPKEVLDLLRSGGESERW